MSKEIWEDVLGFEGLYWVSNRGRVKSNKKILKPYRGKYLRLCLCKNGLIVSRLVHRLVLASFKGLPDENQECNHIDGDKYNNNIDNLEWVTSSENTFHAYRNNLLRPPDKPVLMFTHSGDFIKKFNSPKEVEKALSFNRKCIANACRGLQKTSYNYYWKYEVINETL